MKQNLILIFILFGFIKIEAQVLENLSSHVYFLSDDKLEGRSVGSVGEKIAQEYISSYFTQYGLEPMGEKGFIQPFKFTLGKKLTNVNSLQIGEKVLELENDYFPLVYSANASINSSLINVGYGIDAGDSYNDYKNKTNLKDKIFVINLSSPDGIHPHSKYKDYTDYKTRIKTAKENGASAIIFFNTEKHVDDPFFDIKRNVQVESLPVVFVQRNMNNVLTDNETVQLSVSMEKDKRVGENVIAYINNGAENTVIFGAHYDHLGWGKDGGSLYKGKPAIHNGADDNASGVATIIELARELKNSNFNNNNYLFICFSAEELGLIGSKSFLLAPTIDISKVNYMVNLDMVGRLNKDTKKLSVGGVGTSSIFQDLIKKGKQTSSYLDIVVKQSGMGPSDHASFYMKNIPVLFLFTGTHQDYHKPSDDAWKINYSGMEDILNFTLDNIVAPIDEKGKIDFQKTKESATKSNKRKFSVTLGVVPDYMFDGKGMKIDGVTDGKPASIAGIIAGDIVIKMGTIEVSDMMSYMTSLGKFKKGDKTIVEIMRNNELKKMHVIF